MFGAFRAERDGFPITDKMWRRKKAATLAERLALGMDALVDRETLAMELWPHAEFNSARNNLYSTISRLRSAFGTDAGWQVVCAHTKMNASDSTATTSRPMYGC